MSDIADYDMNYNILLADANRNSDILNIGWEPWFYILRTVGHPLTELKQTNSAYNIQRIYY